MFIETLKKPITWIAVIGLLLLGYGEFVRGPSGTELPPVSVVIQEPENNLGDGEVISPVITSYVLSATNTIDVLLANKTPTERKEIRRKIVAAVPLRGKVVHNTLGKDIEIEIISVEEIEGKYVEILARAWTVGKNNKRSQLGFGPNGTVDIERFRLNNPAVLVYDPNGELSYDRIGPDGNPITLKLRQDPEYNLVNSVATMAALYGKSETNIVADTVGHTLAEFLVDDAAAGSYDINTYTYSCNDTWAEVTTNLATCSQTESDSAYGTVQMKSDAGSPNWERLVKYQFSVDTSSIAPNEVSSSTVLLGYDNSAGGTSDPQNRDPTYLLFEGTFADPDAITGADILDCEDVDLSNSVAQDSWNSAGWNVFTLNAAGLAAIDTGGSTLYCFQNNFMATPASAPTWGAANNYSYVHFDSSDANIGGGTATDPRLVVDYAPAAAATPSLGDIIIFD